MSFKTALRARIMANGTVTAQGAGVYWGARPQGSAFPAVVLTMIAGQADQHMQGVIATQGNRVQASIFATKQSQAETLRQAVQGVMMAEATSGGITFQGGFVNLYRDSVESTQTGEVYSEIIDATIWFN